MTRITLIAIGCLLVACPSADDDDSADPSVIYAFPEGDAVESEPNESQATATDLGVIGVEYAVTGASSPCGASGTFDGADHDFLSFSLDTDQPVRFRLDMRGGDLDLAIFDDAGELIAEATETGLEDEELALALDPERVWTARIRCWQGNDDAIWRLRLL